MCMFSGHLPDGFAHSAKTEEELDDIVKEYIKTNYPELREGHYWIAKMHDGFSNSNFSKRFIDLDD